MDGGCWSGNFVFLVLVLVFAGGDGGWRWKWRRGERGRGVRVEMVEEGVREVGGIAGRHSWGRVLARWEERGGLFVFDIEVRAGRFEGVRERSDFFRERHHLRRGLACSGLWY